jgi:hypothetical protein
MADPLVPVLDVPCFHGGEHPGGHVVALKANLGLAGVVVARRKIIGSPPDEDEITGVLLETFVRHGVAQVDGLTATTADIEGLIDAPDSGIMVGNAASELYGDTVLAPFVQMMPKSLPDSQTASSTSPTKDGSRKPRKRSKPSSTSTTPTDSIETTMPVPG